MLRRNDIRPYATIVREAMECCTGERGNFGDRCGVDLISTTSLFGDAFYTQNKTGYNTLTFKLTKTLCQIY